MFCSSQTGRLSSQTSRKVKSSYFINVKATSFFQQDWFKTHAVTCISHPLFSAAGVVWEATLALKALNLQNGLAGFAPRVLTRALLTARLSTYHGQLATTVAALCKCKAVVLLCQHSTAHPAPHQEFCEIYSAAMPEQLLIFCWS